MSASAEIDAEHVDTSLKLNLFARVSDAAYPIDERQEAKSTFPRQALQRAPSGTHLPGHHGGVGSTFPIECP